MHDPELTAEIAAAAAKLVADDGYSYAEAKRRAAQALGGSGAKRSGGHSRSRARAEPHGMPLPTDEAVEDAVREHLALFHAATQPAELRALRELALRWMRRLAELRPHLSGSVWRGTATRRSNVLIDLYGDDPKAAEIAFLNGGIEFESLGGSQDDTPILSVTDVSSARLGPVTVNFAIHDYNALRGALKPDARGQTWRADTATLSKALES